MGKVIGIDLGTTNSYVAGMSGGDRSSSPTQRRQSRPLCSRHHGQEQALGRTDGAKRQNHPIRKHHLLMKLACGPKFKGKKSRKP